MKKIKSKPSILIDPKSRLEEKSEPYEIIYADPRDEEIHLKFLKETRLSAHMARWFLDYEYNQLIWSDGVYEILEIDTRKFGATFQNFIEKVHPDDRYIKNQAQQDLKKTSKPIELNYRLLFKGNRIKWINEICNTDFDQEGYPIRSYGTIQDITRYKLSEENFRQKEERFKSLIESIPSGIAIIQDNKFAFINSAAKRLFGWNTQVQSKGKNITHIVHSESKTNLLKKLKSVIHDQTEPTFEEKLMRLDGSSFDAEITLIQTIFQGSPAIQIIVNDISERKKTEEALRKSEEKFRILAVNLSENEIRLKELIETKDKFFSIIAHDLRSPFNSLIGFIDLLWNKYEDLDDAEKKNYLKLMDDDANQTLKLLNNLLEWAMSQTGKISFQPKVQKLLSIVMNVEDTLHSALNLKSLKLNYDIPDQLEIFADKNMLTTILQNLINNAIKYSYPEGTITVKADLKDDLIEIVISDSGTGMNEEIKNKLFRIDEQISIPGTDNEKGSGLGLILCKDFIERHKGRIWVESELEKGSKFIFTMPNFDC